MLINWIDKSVSWVRAFLERGFLIKTVLISTLVSVFLQVPSFPEIEALFPTRAILEISNSPWTQIHYDAGSHAEKKTLRPLVPLIANVLRLKHTWQVYFLFAVANAVLLFLIARLLECRTGDRLVAFLVTLGLSCAYFGFSGYSDTKGWGDVIPFVLILCSMVWPRTMVVLIAHFLAMAGDERSVISAVFACWWFVCISDRSFEKSLICRILAQRHLIMASLFAMVAYVAMRCYMHINLGFNMPMGNVGLPVLLEQNVEHLLPGLWGAFEGYWILLLLYVVGLFLTKKWMDGLLILVGMTGYSIACMMVHDVTRSISYVFPVVVLAIVEIHRDTHTRSRTDYLFLLVTFLNVLGPTYYLYGKLRSYAPAFFRIIQFLR